MSFFNDIGDVFSRDIPNGFGSIYNKGLKPVGDFFAHDIPDGARSVYDNALKPLGNTLGSVLGKITDLLQGGLNLTEDLVKYLPYILLAFASLYVYSSLK
jgi:hypothetical protein